jgi:hypothetical protein
MLTISFWNKIVSFSVIIPLIYGFINWRQLYAVRTIIYILIVSFLFESIATVSLTIYKIPAPNIGVFYQAIEIFFFSIFISKIIELKYKRFLFSGAFLLIVYSIASYFINETPTSLVYGLSSLFEIIFCSIYLLNNTNNIFSNWKFTIIFAFIQYNLLSVGIISISDYIKLHPQYLNLFFIIHSTTNLFLYLLFTIGLIQCKIQSSKVQL